MGDGVREVKQVLVKIIDAFHEREVSSFFDYHIVNIIGASLSIVFMI